MAGLIVELATGIPFNEYVESRILAPLGITTAGFKYSDIDPDITSGNFEHSGSTPEGWHGDPFFNSPGYPCGDMRISANDLAKVYIAIGHGGTYPDGATILSQDSVDIMLTEWTVDDYGYYYGIGWEIWDWAGTTKYGPYDYSKVTGHSGWYYGCATYAYMDIESGDILFSNTIQTNALNAQSNTEWEFIELLLSKTYND